MARINIEECWWSDPRRSRLSKSLGSEDLADASAVRAWRLAQEFWGKGRALIPLKVWDTVEAGPKLVEAKLAEIKDEGVYVCGSSQYLDWVCEKRVAGRAGGLKSAQSRREKTGSAQPKKSKSSKQNRSTSKQTQPSGSGSDSGSSSIVEEHEKLSSARVHALSLTQDAESVRQFFNDNNLGQLKKYVGNIIHAFGNYQSFANWFDALAEGAEKKADSKAGVQRYVQSAILREIGILKGSENELR